MRQKLAALGLSHVQGMPFLMKEDELARPIHVSQFNTDAVMLDTNLFAK
jgi:hypothetical protein